MSQQVQEKADASRLAAVRHSVSVDLLVDGKWVSAGGIGPDAGPASPGVQLRRAEGGRPDAVVRRVDGGPLGATQVRAVVAVPLLNFAHVVAPDCGRFYVSTNKALEIRRVQTRISGAMVGHPFLALADEAGRFFFAFGVVLPPIDVSIYRILPQISKRIAMVGGDELLSMAFEWELSADSTEVAVDWYVGLEQMTWVHALREYCEAVKARYDIRYTRSEEAWTPTWCSWTAFPSAELTAERVLENARFAKELGVGTIIIDDGWFGPGLDDDGPETLNIGDYYPDPRKFPDLRKLVSDVQALGLKVLLWHAPLCIAEGSQAYKTLKPYLMKSAGKTFVSGNGLMQLCPGLPQVRQYVCEETERLIRTYGVDGLKVDLFNCLPATRCECPAHQHDVIDSVGAVAAVMSDLWDRARQVRPDILLELKQDYGNVHLAQYGTMVRAGDTAYDVDTNARRCFYTQAFADTVHNDYFVTSIYTERRAVALMMIRAMASGVPTFGIDFARIDASLRAEIGWWMNFYRTNRRLFQTLREPQNNELSVWQGGDIDTAWVAAIFQSHRVTIPDAGRVLLMNGTGQDSLRIDSRGPLTVVVFDRDGETWRGECVGGEDLRVPSGSVAELRRQ